ncbi:MAG TPA: hypothetical protein PLQ56_07300, partial [Aggregatilineales bacterium]|nr:hypothetical protein [Aggregatilineales bacterium]
MADALKDSLYSPAFIEDLGKALVTVYPSFDQGQYRQQIYDEQWSERALKQRTRHVTTVVHDLLASNYRDALAVLQAAAPQLSHYSYAPI